MYADINYLELLKFKGCDDCIECCKKPMAPLVLEDFEKVYVYFPILIAKLDYLKPVMLLSAKNSCPYLKNNKCNIYENRPPACKIYPYSPWYNKILLDLSCKGIGTAGKSIPLNKKEFIKSAFYDERFDNIQHKIEKTYTWLKKQKLKQFKKHKGIQLFLMEENRQDIYCNFHRNSLKNLKNYF